MSEGLLLARAGNPKVQPVAAYQPTSLAIFRTRRCGRTNAPKRQKKNPSARKVLGLDATHGQQQLRRAPDSHKRRQNGQGFEWLTKTGPSSHALKGARST